MLPRSAPCRHHRWEEQLQLFDIKLKYKPRRFHVILDILSRRPNHRHLDPLPEIFSIFHSDPLKIEALQTSTLHDSFAQLVIGRIKMQDL